MIESTISRIRLTAVAAILIGSSVASSVASATTESPSADPPIVEPAPDDRDAPVTTVSAVEPSPEPAPPGPGPVHQLAPEWSSGFRLEAASRTGSSKAMAATCTYPGSSTDLSCQFHNPGHGDIVDGMVVPARPTATYTVSVSGGAGDSDPWSISNANGGPYSARALCPRGGDGGHDDGGHEAGALSADAGGGGEAFYSMHAIEMHQLESAVPPEEIPPPETEPPPTVLPEEIPPPETEPPPTVPPEEIPPPETEPLPTAESPTTATPSVPVTQNTLPSTGNEVLVVFGIGALMVAVGAVLVAQTRRRRIDGLPSPFG